MQSRLLLSLFITVVLFISVTNSAPPPTIPDTDTTDVEVLEVNPNPVILSDGQTLAEVEFEEDDQTLKSCRLYELDDAADAAKEVEKIGLPVKSINFKQMLEIIDMCKVFVQNDSLAYETDNNETSTNDVKWGRWSLWDGIFPGTKWCGMGDIAKSYTDLGQKVELDTCCRSHDFCPVKLKAFRSGFGLVNFSFYTKSHCDCDRRFYDCLKETNTRSADVMGNFYFNIMRVQCLKAQPFFVCTEKKTLENGKTRCIRWKIDLDNAKMVASDRERRY